MAKSRQWRLKLVRGIYLAQVLGTDLQKIIEVAGEGEEHVYF
jgi:hypothetical protein